MAADGVAIGTGTGRAPRGSILNDPLFRSIIIQLLLAAALIAFVWWIAHNTIVNLRRLNIASGFDFLWERSGFDIGQTLIRYTQDSTYGRALLVGFLNTLLIAVLGIVFATIIGLILGIARLSRNWLVAKLATVYVEVIRNIPVLLQLLFWYKAVLSVLPNPKQGFILQGDVDPLSPFRWLLDKVGVTTGPSPLTFHMPTVALNNRGLLLPVPVPGPDFTATWIALGLAVIATAAIALWAHTRQRRTGAQFPTFRTGLALIVLVPLAIFLLTGSPLTFDAPVLKGFNFVGGVAIKPEFMALLLGLTLYTAAYIGEIVRAGILAVPWGQTEAAYALGLRRGVALRRVIIPQALRVIIPPLTSQYLNLTKNSSLAVAVGYPDLVSVFSGTTLNQTGQAVEIIFMTMLVYLAISLTTSLAMNIFNRRVALRER
ncbi:MAG: amino acid ABC transporter permease [Rhizobiales bacterium]|nr:amino acid ABC transporter permease [Hyphomicrobiales bacterium]